VTNISKIYQTGYTLGAGNTLGAHCKRQIILSINKTKFNNFDKEAFLNNVGTFSPPHTTHVASYQNLFAITNHVD
jgi:hypothetical protein